MRGRRARLRVLGAALVLYGIVGIAIFILVGIGVARPLDRAATLSASVDSDRQALVESLSQAELTIREMSTGVGRMDTSLADAKTAIDKAATISHGIAASMYSLRDAMNVNILGAQPLSGLSGSFDTSGQNLDALGDDISTIGTSLDANRSDVVATAQNLNALADSVHALTATVENGPSFGIDQPTLDSARLGIYAIVIWMGLLASGCVALGIYLLHLGGRQATA